MNPVSAGNRGGRRFGAAQSILLSMAALGLLAALAWILTSPTRIRAQNSGAPATRYVPGGGNLQQALDAANPGDTILLEAGATYTGNFLLRAKQGDAPITIASRALDALPEGVRVTAAESKFMPKLVTPNAESVLQTEARAHDYRVAGVEFTVGAGVYIYDLISLGSPTTKDPDSLAYNLDFDRVLVHGDPNRGGKRGIALNSRSTIIRNSYFTDFASDFQDSQDIAGWNGPGPYVILNNRLEASGMSVMFGGAAPAIEHMVPADIVFYNNYVTRPMSWHGKWRVKNLFELKSARNVDVQYNVFENNWIGGQSGFAILFTVRTCEAGDYPWAVIQDVTFSHNIVRRSEGGGVNILGRDSERSACRTPATGKVTIGGTQVKGQDTRFTAELKPGYHLVAGNVSRAIKQIADDRTLVLESAWPDGAPAPTNFAYFVPVAGQTSNITISDNLFDAIRPFDGSADGTFVMILSGARNIRIEHNTAFPGKCILVASGAPSQGVVYRNNISPHNTYGIFGDSKGSGVLAIDTYFPGGTITRNVMYGQDIEPIYPRGNFFPAKIEAVGFTDPAKKKYALTAKSKFKNAGTDRRDLGADMGLLDLVEADVVSGRLPQASVLQSAVKRALQAVRAAR
ncbi:MAG: hypothetical protein Q8N47_26605 [Bryobacterales bacterium]|nr:hypothetical protein [Bryobacterales bacterium]